MRTCLSFLSTGGLLTILATSASLLTSNFATKPINLSQPHWAQSGQQGPMTPHRGSGRKDLSHAPQALFAPIANA